MLYRLRERNLPVAPVLLVPEKKYSAVALLPVARYYSTTFGAGALRWVLSSFLVQRKTVSIALMTNMKSCMSVHRFVAFLYLLTSVAIGSNIKRTFSIVNHSGVKFEVFWVHPKTREGILLTPPNVGIRDGARQPFDSFVGHEFEIRETPGAETGECNNENNVCHSATFIVSETEHRCESLCALLWLGLGRAAISPRLLDNLSHPSCSRDGDMSM